MPSRTTRRCGPCDGDCTPCEMHGFCHLCEVEKLTAAVEERDALLERATWAIRHVATGGNNVHMACVVADHIDELLLATSSSGKGDADVG